MENVTDNIDTKALLEALDLSEVEPNTDEPDCLLDARRAWRAMLLRAHVQPLTMQAIANMGHSERYSLLGNLYTSIALRNEAANHIARAYVDMGSGLAFAVDDEIERILDANAEQWLIDCEELFLNQKEADNAE